MLSEAKHLIFIIEILRSAQNDKRNMNSYD